MILVDESGLSERPHRVRTWAPRGQTPVLQYHFNWKVLSAAAGITWWNFYFRLYPTTIHAEEVVDFLGHLLRHLPASYWWCGTVCVSTGPDWSRSLLPRSVAAWSPSSCQPTLPSSIRSNTSGAIGKSMSCPTSVHATSPRLSYQARRTLRRMRRRSPLVQSFWRQAQLSL